MKNLIDRYVYDVTRRLHADTRVDVEKELRSNIEDMLPEDAGDEEITRLLMELGNPAELAEQYRPRPRYLISPALFDDYLTVLKLVSAVLMGIFITGKLISILVESSAADIFTDILPSVLLGVVTSTLYAISISFFWVTLSFALVDYFTPSQNQKEWSPKDLPAIPVDAVKIPRGETIVGMVFSIFFIIFLLGYSHLLAWYKIADGEITLIPVFNEAVLSSFIPIFIALSFISLILASLKLFYHRWSYPLAALSGVSDALGAAAAIIFLLNPNTFNQGLITYIAGLMEISPVVLAGYWQNGVVILVLIIAVINAIEIFSYFRKARRSRLLRG